MPWQSKDGQVCVYLMVHIIKLQQKKYSQTLKKDHQITRMKIICTAVELKKPILFMGKQTFDISFQILALQTTSYILIP